MSPRKSCLALVVVGVCFVAAPVTAAFVEVSVETGIMIDHLLEPGTCNPPITASSAWADYDDDGDLDLFVTNHGGANHLFRNDGDSNFDGIPEFSDQAGVLGIGDPTDVTLAAVFVDYDNDGDQDLMVLNWNGNRFYENSLADVGIVSFTDVAPSLGLVDFGRPITAAWGDFNQDGYLDVYIAKHGECNDFFEMNDDKLFVSNAAASFTDVTDDYLCAADECDAIALGLGFSAAWLDYDDDGDLDLYVVNDNIADTHHHNVMWRNDGPKVGGGWLFTDVSVESKTDTSLNGMGLAVGDVDSDGWLDVAFSNVGPNVMLRNKGNGTFMDVSASTGIARPETPNGDVAITWGTAFLDYDSDTDLDLFIVGGYIASAPFEQPDVFFENNSDGSFSDVTTQVGLGDEGRGRGASMADLDDDGYVDLVVTRYGEPPLIYRNEPGGGGPNRRVKITLEGTVGNRDAIGSRLWLDLGQGRNPMRHVSSGPTHGGGDSRETIFGMAQHRNGELVVRWPDLQMQQIGQVDSGTTVHLVQPQFVVGAPSPGIAGQTNTVEVTGATPGGLVYLLRSEFPGHTDVPTCDRIAIALDSPSIRDKRNADGDGRVVFEDFVTAGAAGTIGYYQAADAAACAVSSRRAIEWLAP